MISLLGSLLGFVTSFLPNILRYLENGRDQRHELQIMSVQFEYALKLGEKRVEGLQVDAGIREIESIHNEQRFMIRKASQWCVNLASSVRPVVTYALFFEFSLLTIALFFDWITIEQFGMVWNEQITAVWAAVLAYWFGSRSFNRQ